MSNLPGQRKNGESGIHNIAITSKARIPSETEGGFENVMWVVGSCTLAKLFNLIIVVKQ